MMEIELLPQGLRNRLRAPRVPGPSMMNMFNFARNMRKDPLAYMKSMRETYGDIVRLPFSAIMLFQVTDPALIGKLLLGTEKTNKKSLGYRRIRPLLGDGLITSNGELWKSQRRLSNPAFHHRVIQGLAGMIAGETKKMLDDWDKRIEQDPEIEISHEMTHVTFTIIMKALFSTDASDKTAIVRESLSKIQNHASYLFYTPLPLPLWVPTAYNRDIRRALKNIDDIVYEVIAEHRRGNYNDLLSVFMSSRDEATGEGMSDKLLRDEVITLMLAGHDTTAVTLAIITDLLARNPDKKQKLLEEIRTLPESGPQLEDLPALTYTGLIFSEAMRLYPAAWSIGREITEDLVYGDYVFPKGSTFLLPQFLMHRHPQYWENPEDFIPERFEKAPLHPFAYFPFGGGQRTCIGSNLAKLEAQIILPMLLRRFDLASVPGHSYSLLPRISLLLDKGVRLKVLRRNLSEAVGP